VSAGAGRQSGVSVGTTTGLPAGCAAAGLPRLATMRTSFSIPEYEITSPSMMTMPKLGSDFPCPGCSGISSSVALMSAASTAMIVRDGITTSPPTGKIMSFNEAMT
jgi:hypothetical protein